eukprot:TRINITY_DN16504_c0_g1_i1.p1 TRINITY_DN16504_c0_g1~~TRINITY_DN16504_c0_g1_i1.p1  ORF type:complete len:366 (-),score=95.21 TRINITY_DN16504_c0_g1_i1:65-1162(-)
MGISHSMNTNQVDQVLTQFENTTQSIRGIENKVARVDGYIITAHKQRQQITSQMDDATNVMDHMTDSMNERSEIAVTYMTKTLDIMADLVESFEQAVVEIGILDLPREVWLEMGPVVIPVVVLVLILTCSNSVFGFMLAGDEKLVGAFDMNPDKETLGEEEEFNVLRLFAVFHVSLLGVALLYLMIELCRRAYKNREAAWKKMKKVMLDEENLEREAMAAGSEEEEEADRRHVEEHSSDSAGPASPKSLQGQEEHIDENDTPSASMRGTLRQSRSSGSSFSFLRRTNSGVSDPSPGRGAGRSDPRSPTLVASPITEFLRRARDSAPPEAELRMPSPSQLLAKRRTGKCSTLEQDLKIKPPTVAVL